MTQWNVYLNRRQLTIQVTKILIKTQEFIVIVDQHKNQHKLSEIDFPSFEWAKIGVGSSITLTVSESVTRWRVKPAPIKTRIQEFISGLESDISGYFFVWVCEYCETMGHVEYEEGDDNWAIAKRVVQAHKKEIKPECEMKVRIFDHRGVEQKDSALLISSRRIK